MPLAYSNEFRATPFTFQLRHSEMVESVKVPSSGNDFSQLLAYDINAGDKQSFPWLSSIARSFDKYRLTNLQFKYVPVVPTTTVGDIAMVFIGDSR